MVYKIDKIVKNGVEYVIKGQQGGGEGPSVKGMVYGTGKDGNCVIDKDTTMPVGDYEFCNFTICPNTTLCFCGNGIPTFKVCECFDNRGTIDLRSVRDIQACTRTFYVYGDIVNIKNAATVAIPSLPFYCGGGQGGGNRMYMNSECLRGGRGGEAYKEGCLGSSPLCEGYTGQSTGGLNAGINGGGGGGGAGLCNKGFNGDNASDTTGVGGRGGDGSNETFAGGGGGGGFGECAGGRGGRGGDGSYGGTGGFGGRSYLGTGGQGGVGGVGSIQSGNGGDGGASYCGTGGAGGSITQGCNACCFCVCGGAGGDSFYGTGGAGGNAGLRTGNNSNQCPFVGGNGGVSIFGRGGNGGYGGDNQNPERTSTLTCIHGGRGGNGGYTFYGTGGNGGTGGTQFSTARNGGDGGRGGDAVGGQYAILIAANEGYNNVICGAGGNGGSGGNGGNYCACNACFWGGIGGRGGNGGNGANIYIYYNCSFSTGTICNKGGAAGSGGTGGVNQCGCRSTNGSTGVAGLNGITQIKQMSV